MLNLKRITGVALAAAFMVSAVPSSAVVTTFATFDPIGSTRNIRWVKTGTSGGQLYTTATATATTPGSAHVNFSLLGSLASYVNNANAIFTLNANTTAGHAATIAGGFLFQNVTSGTFSFTSTAPITIGSTTFAAGSNLLSATFTNGTIAGGNRGTSGGISGSTEGGNIVNYTSDFLDFSATISRDWSLAFTSANPVLSRSTVASALNSFRGTTGGNFSSDPAPGGSVPEPQVWGLLITGLGLVGVQMRRRSRQTAVSA